MSYLGDGAAGFVFNLERCGSLTAGPAILFLDSITYFLNNFKVSIPVQVAHVYYCIILQRGMQPPSSLSLSMGTGILPFIWPGADWTL